MKIVKLKTLIAVFALMILTALLSLLSNKIENKLAPFYGPTAALMGLILSYTLYRGLLAFNQKLRVFHTQSIKKTLAGAGLSAGIFVLSLVLIQLSDPVFSQNKEGVFKYLSNILFQIRASTLEEVGFRFGVVGLALLTYSRPVALLLGSIPFGLLHLVNFLSGDPIMWDYILGTSIAGFYLSAVFIRFGLLSAILAHYVWNLLSSSLGFATNLSQMRIEAASETYFILIIFGIGILTFKKDSINN